LADPTRGITAGFTRLIRSPSSMSTKSRDSSPTEFTVMLHEFDRTRDTWKPTSCVMAGLSTERKASAKPALVTGVTPGPGSGSMVYCPGAASGRPNQPVSAKRPVYAGSKAMAVPASLRLPPMA
jgi:hypothetical protein